MGCLLQRTLGEEEKKNNNKKHEKVFSIRSIFSSTHNLVFYETNFLKKHEGQDAYEVRAKFLRMSNFCI